MTTVIVWFLFLIFSAVVTLVKGHGRLVVPVSRSSAWRDGFKTPKNYNDDELFCGGLGFLMNMGMKCGVCGDPYTTKRPRDNENGGKYGKGVIVAKYTAGSAIKVQVYLSSNLLGRFNFSLCALQSANQLEEESCFKYLKLSDGNDIFTLPDRTRGAYNFTVQLPEGQTCEHCVFRWIYFAGNNWGCDDDNNWEDCCIGCGTKQEHFYGCADIAIA